METRSIGAIYPLGQFPTGGRSMVLLTLAVVFVIIALAAWLLGARGFAGFSWGIAKFLIIIFIVLFLITLVLGLGGL